MFILFYMQAFTAYAVNKVTDIEMRKKIKIESNDRKNWPKGPVIEAQSAIVMEASTGTVLYEKNIHDPLYPASITKIMTTLIALEKTNLDEIVTFSHNSLFDIEAGSSIIGGVNEGDKMTMEQCLYGIMLCSGNEAAYAVAEHIGGDISTFVKMMNEKAKELGCQDTNFKNPHGLHDEEHFVSAYDMAIISKAALKNSIFRTITGTVYYEFPPTQKGERRPRTNHHKMLPGLGYSYEGCIGGKTGGTQAAGSTLVTFAQRNNMTLITVVLNEKDPSQYNDTKALLDYGFDEFHLLNLKENIEEFQINNDNFFQMNNDFITLDPEGCVVIPNNINFSDLETIFELKEENSSIIIKYNYKNIYVGETSAKLKPYTDYLNSTNVSGIKEKYLKWKGKLTIKNVLILILIIVIIFLLLLFFINHTRRKRSSYYSKRKRKDKLDFDKRLMK